MVFDDVPGSSHEARGAPGTLAPIGLSTTRTPMRIVRAAMVIAQSAGRRSRRPMLLTLVFGVVLVLVGVTAGALAAVVSANLSSARLNTVVTYDAALVELFVNYNVRAADLDAGGPTPALAALLPD